MVLLLAILTLDGSRENEALDARGSFTLVERVAPPRTWEPMQVALVMPELRQRVITEVGEVRRDPQRVATSWQRLRYTRLFELERPLDFAEVLESVPTRFHRSIGGRVALNGSLPPKSGAALLDAVVASRPEIAGALRRALRTEGSGPVALSGDALQAAAHEADVVRLALDLTGVPRTRLGAVRPDGEVSFVARLAQMRVPEDSAISYDSLRFLDFDRLDRPSGVVEFVQGSERLTVLNVNRQPLERTTGADLIYVNEPRGSVVLVQYKTMRRLAANAPGLGYRPDAQLATELDRMRRLVPTPGDGTPASWRLHPGSGFLKLCRPVVALDFEPRKLVGGMYLPLELWDELAASPQVRGPRGGVVFSYDSVGRHLTNDLFVGLVRGGWIGSRGAGTSELMEIIVDGLAADRSITVAAVGRERDH